MRRTPFFVGAAAWLVVAGCGTKSAALRTTSSTTSPRSTTTGSPGPTLTTGGPATTASSRTTIAPRPTHPPGTSSVPTSAPSAPGPTTTYATPTTLAYNQTQVPSCASHDLSAAAYTDHTSYSAGMTVNVVVVVTNRGTRPCAYSDSASVSITDQSGATVFPTAGFGHPGCPNGVLAAPPTYLLNPGESFDATRASWDQLHHSCTGPDPGPRYPPGRYTAVASVYAHDGPVNSMPAPFQLV